MLISGNKNGLLSGYIVIALLTVGFVGLMVSEGVVDEEGMQAKEINNLISRSNNHVRENDFDWNNIEVMSEPIVGQDNNIHESIEPKIVVENDKIYVIWKDDSDYHAPYFDGDIFYRYFNGNNWEEIQNISEPIPGYNSVKGDSINPDIAVEDGKIYVVWSDSSNISNAGKDKDIFYRTNLTGKGWEEIQVISEPIKNKNYNVEYSSSPSITVENGKIYVVWNDYNNTNNAGSDSDLFYRCNHTGSKWENIQVISEPVFNKNFNIGDVGEPIIQGYPAISSIAVENGKIYVVWQDNNNTNNASTLMPDYDIFYRCNLSGNSWESIQVISEPIFNEDQNIAPSLYPDIEVENNRIYITWQDGNNTYDCGIDDDIFFITNFTQKGWDEIQVISEPAIGANFNFKNSYDPKLTVENGIIYVVWVDENNTNNAGPSDLAQGSEIFFRYKYDESFWEPIQVISEPVFGSNINLRPSYKPDIAINLGRTNIVWYADNNADNSGGDTDIYFRKGTNPSPLFIIYPLVTTFQGYSDTFFNYTATYFHYENKSPTIMNVKIDGLDYPMLEVDTTDNNYIDGKEYFFIINNLDVGMHKYQFYATDGQFAKFTILKNNPLVFNTPPKIITNNNIKATEDTYYKVYYEYEDMDVENVDQVIKWNFSSNANWLKFNPSTAILNGTPTNEDVGKYWVNITISDTMNFNFSNFTLTVINVNDAPIIITNNTEITNDDEFYEVFYEAVDIDTPQNNITWSLSTNASWLKLNPETSVLYGTPANDDVGVFWVNLTVSDSEEIAYSNFTLTVININDPPTIITEDIIISTEDEFYEVLYKAEDVDNAQSELTWKINTDAEWLIYNVSNSIINGTPTNNDVGEYWVNISVNDGDYLDYTNFTLTVKNINDPPIIITESEKKVIVGETYSVDYEALDIDLPPLALTWSVNSNALNWLSIDTTTGWLHGDPTNNDVGTYWVNISVDDNNGGYDYQNFTVTVESSEETISKEETSWFWIILIIILIITILTISMYLFYKRKVAQIPTVKAELLPPKPEQMALPTPHIEEAKPLQSEPQVLQNLPSQDIQVQQLPQSTLTNAQKLNLLKERLIRGEVTEDTYKELKKEIEDSQDSDKTLEDENVEE